MKKSKKVFRLMASMISCIMLISACSGKSNTPPVSTSVKQEGKTESNSDTPNKAITMTDVGTPRAETLIVDMLNGRAANTTQLNPYLPGAVYQGNGFRQLIWEHLWDIDSMNGKQIPTLAESMAEPMDDTFTKFKVKLREGVKWSDGVDCTSDDVVFTSNMLLNTPELTFSPAFSKTVKSITAIDKYTIEIETVERETRIEQFLGTIVTDCNFKVVPKHIWENIDPKTFQNENSVGTGPYMLKQIDPQGNWFLFEKRKDWDASAAGIIYGDPKPNFVLFRTYGSEEKRVMAAINNDMDILCDISPESWTVLKDKNPEALSWYDNFPYADMDDPATRGIMFNCETAPFNDVDVRWALLLAIDLNNVSLSTYSGMLRTTPIVLAPTQALSKTYHKPMVPWLKELTLSDGYKPFDENFSANMVETLKKQGIEGLPSDMEAIKDLFGVGWWRYDVEQAEKLLVSKGFTRNKSGKWLKPDGSVWQVSLSAPSGFEIIAERLGYSIVDSWQKFGIDAVVQPCDAATWNANMQAGNYECIIAWPSMSVLEDAIGAIRQWHSKYVVPNGENTSTGQNTGACSRWKNGKVDAILDELSGLSTDDPRVIELITDFQKELVVNAPFAAMIGTTKLVPVTTHYWTNFQTANNPFEGPWWWWANFEYSLSKYEPTGNQ